MQLKNIALILVITGLFSCRPGIEKDRLITVELNSDWKFRQVNTDNWLSANVPGSVHTDLLNNDSIADPFYRLNERQLQWIDKADWEYRTIFKADRALLDRGRAELVFEGLDTYAKVYLNGNVLLEADNMFRTWIVDVRGKLKEGENELVVLLESPTKKGLEALKAYGFQLAADNDQSEAGEMGGDRVSPYVRKAPYHFGWDWGPRLVTSGIWRPVKLRVWSIGHIADVNIVTENLTTDKAELVAKLVVEIQKAGKYYFELECDSIRELADGVPFDLLPGKNQVEIPFTIKNPHLWQPNGLGSQKLYNFKVELFADREILDSRTARTGLRTVKLVQEADPDGKGKSFYFEVNGKPVFAKGANYIPNDVFLDRVSPGKYEYIVKSAADANMNMLRVWGGGIYENDLFYDLCDNYGIMVWQDFMFACAMYPGNDGFLENVRREAIDNVKRLRNHPCIVLWCGNNEIEAAWGPYDEKRGWGWKQRYSDEQRATIWKAYDTLFHKILPGVILEEDPGRPYWHSSPSAGMGQLASYETASGDIHYWGVWHGLHPFTDFRKYLGRFMSEYGFQSFPEFNSVKKYTLPEDHTIESEVMMAHQRSGIGNLRIRQYMAEDYIIPQDFEQFLYVGQLLQAEAIKLAIESHRAVMPYCMGSLYWQINDCWPVASWSGIDYYGRWKALHYFVREAFKPTVLVSSEENGMVMINLVSDQPYPDKLKLAVTLKDFAGKILWKVENNEGFSGFIGFRLNEILANVDPSSVVLISEIIDGDKIIDRDLHYFVRTKDLKLTEPGIMTEIIDKGEVVEVVLTSKNLAKNVFLYADGIEGQFSDNYFDILPGETVSVIIPKDAITLESIKYLKVLHLFLTTIR